MAISICLLYTIYEYKKVNSTGNDKAQYLKGQKNNECDTQLADEQAEHSDGSKTWCKLDRYKLNGF